MQMKISQIMQVMQNNDLLKSNENSEDNAKVTAYINATIIIPSSSIEACKNSNILNHSVT
jgi:hypothetical protein